MEYWTIGSFTRSRARTAHSFACNPHYPLRLYARSLKSAVAHELMGKRLGNEGVDFIQIQPTAHLGVSVRGVYHGRFSRRRWLRTSVLILILFPRSIHGAYIRQIHNALLRFQGRRFFL